MHSFKDNEGREWHLAVNVATVKRLRQSELAVDLLDLVDGREPERSLLVRLAADPVLLVDVLYVICQPEAEKRGVSDVEFGEAMAGEVIDRATEALLAEITDFTPNRRDRQRLRRGLEKIEAMMETGRTILDERLEAADLDGELRKLLRTAGECSSSSPGSPESSPGGSPPGSSSGVPAAGGGTTGTSPPG